MSPGQWTTPGQWLPRGKCYLAFTWWFVVPGQCCHGASSSLYDHYEFILIPLVFTQIVTENEFCTCLLISGAFGNFLLEKFIPNIDTEHAQDYSCPGATFAFCSHGEKLPRQGGLPGVVQRVTRLSKLPRGNEKLMWTVTGVRPCTEAKLTPGSVSCPGAMSCPGIMWTGPKFIMTISYLQRSLFESPKPQRSLLNLFNLAK